MKTCKDCEQPITRYAARCKSCANRLRSKGKNHKGKNNPNWQGGTRKTPEGRILLYAPDNPMSDGQGYVRRSRLVMSELVGRDLTREEIVHHRDGAPTNDSPDNLRLFKNHSEHTKHHQKIRKVYRLLRDAAFDKQLCTPRIGGTTRLVAA